MGAGNLIFQALSQSGQNIARGLEKRETRIQQEQNELKRAKTIQSLLQQSPELTQSLGISEDTLNQASAGDLNDTFNALLSVQPLLQQQQENARRQEQIEINRQQAETSRLQAETAAENLRLQSDPNSIQNQRRLLDFQNQQTAFEIKKLELAQALQSAPAEAQKIQNDLKIQEQQIQQNAQKIVKTDKDISDKRDEEVTAAFNEGLKLKKIDDSINLIIDKVEEATLPATGRFSEVVTSNLPFTTNASEVRSLIKEIKADAAFTELLKLKKEGGTLGQIAVAELELLQAAAGSLDPSLGKDQFISNLRNFQETRKSSVLSTIDQLRERGLDIPKPLLDIAEDITPTQTQATTVSPSEPIEISDTSELPAIIESSQPGQVIFLNGKPIGRVPSR